MGLKNSITQLENSRGNLTRLDQTEDKISRLEDKIEGLDHTSKENEKEIKSTGKENAGPVRYHVKSKSLNYRHT